MAVFGSGLLLHQRHNYRRLRAVCLAAAVLLQLALGEDCDAYSDCSSCAAVAGCSWALKYDCTWGCLSVNTPEDLGGDPKVGNPLRRDCWRHEIGSSDKCGEAFNYSCEALNDGISDRSFEQSNDDNPVWVYARKIPQKDSKFCTGAYLPVEGQYYLATGTSDSAGKLDYKLTTDSLVISNDATHLSMYFMTAFSSPAQTEMDELTSFTIMVDGFVIFRLDRFNWKKYWTDGVYDVMDIKLSDDIKNITEGESNKRHSLQITFTENLDSDDIMNTFRSFIFIDYIQVIKKNGKKKAYPNK